MNPDIKPLKIFKPNLRFLTIIYLILIIPALLSCESTENGSSTIVEKFGQLGVSGNRVVDKNGNPVALYGMSLFWSQIKGQYYNYKCVKWLRDDWKCTVVRAAMGIGNADGLDGYLVNRDAEFNKVISVIDAAIDLGIYVVVDWHDHHAHENKDEAIEFFTVIAQRYGDKPNIIYEIYNEPMQISWKDDVKPYSEEVVKAIRADDPDNLIIIGTTTWSQDVDIASEDPLEGENLVYSLHYYASSHKQYLRDKAQKALDNGAALFVSEYGTTEYTGDGIIDTAEVNAWFNFLEENKISWCNWSIGDKAEASAALKPGANAEGGWTDDEISFSGHIVRDKIRSYNSRLFPADEDQ